MILVYFVHRQTIISSKRKDKYLNNIVYINWKKNKEEIF